MDKQCQYCGDPLIPAHRDFGICAWCLKDIEDSKAKAKENIQPSYFNGDREEYKGEIDYG
jgi:hypothetical protein